MVEFSLVSSFGSALVFFVGAQETLLWLAMLVCGRGHGHLGKPTTAVAMALWAACSGIINIIDKR